MGTLAVRLEVLLLVLLICEHGHRQCSQGVSDVVRMLLGGEVMQEGGRIGSQALLVDRLLFRPNKPGWLYGRVTSPPFATEQAPSRQEGNLLTPGSQQS